MPLKDVAAIVTGGASGLGRAMTLGLARAGARVVATASSSKEQLEQLANDINRDLGQAQVIPLQADVTRHEDCRRVIGETVQRFGKLNVLVNNAGRGMKYVSETFLTQPAPFWETDPEIWRLIVDTNVNGPFLMSRNAVPHMLAAGWGRIINISMNEETMRRKGFSPYGPSKAALESETIIWAKDLEATTITVNSLLPGGPVNTGMIPDSFPQTMRARLLSPEVIVPPLIWLASERSAETTGKRIIATEWSERGSSQD